MKLPVQQLRLKERGRKWQDAARSVETKMNWGCKGPANTEFKGRGKSPRRMTMRNKLPLLALSLALGAGWIWAGPPTTDTQAAETIQSRLDKAKVDKHGNVQVTFDNGVATLTGTVDNLGSKLDAEKAARKAPGVNQVVDNIQVRAEDLTDQQILREGAPRDCDVLRLRDFR